MKKLIMLFAALALWPNWAHADFTWDTPIGTIGIPLQATESFVGYDGILKQAIAGLSVPVYTDPHKFVSLQVGAGAPWPTNGNAIEPYFALGHDIAREIPMLAQYNSLHINAFGRYASTQGKAGAGISVSYSFLGPTPAQ